MGTQFMGGDISGWSARWIYTITTNETNLKSSRHCPHNTFKSQNNQKQFITKTIGESSDRSERLK